MWIIHLNDSFFLAATSTDEHLPYYAHITPCRPEDSHRGQAAVTANGFHPTGNEEYHQNYNSNICSRPQESR